MRRYSRTGFQSPTETESVPRSSAQTGGLDALRDVLAGEAVLTPDLGGNASTNEFGEAVAECLWE